MLTSALLAFAFVAAPRSCEWGNEAYFWAGIGTLVLLFSWPFVLHAGRSALIRTGLGVGFAVIGLVIWFGGLFAANFRIVCTLF